VDFGDFMNLDEAELEKSYFEPAGKGVDKTVGYVLIGLIVVLCFTTFVFGINRIQSASDNVIDNHARSTDRAMPDISDTVDPAKE